MSSCVSGDELLNCVLLTAKRNLQPAGRLAIRPVRRMLLEFHYRTQMNPRHAESALLINDAVRYVPLNAQTTLGRQATISFVTRRNSEICSVRLFRRGEKINNHRAKRRFTTHYLIRGAQPFNAVIARKNAEHEF